MLIFGGKDKHFFINGKAFAKEIIPFSYYSCGLRSFFFVPLAPPKVLSFDNKNEKRLFILYCAHLIVPLHPK